jgi:arabinogalactan endo-1,4-beta-galactosidase
MKIGIPLAAIGALAFLAGCEVGLAPPTPLSVPASVFLGADISSLERIEQGGMVFSDDARSGDAIAILRAHGSTVFRLRLFVDPDHLDVRVNDLAYTIRMAQRIKAAGGKLLLDFHYSDTWADPGHQATPAAWASLPFDSLELRVESYSDSVITQLKAAGALPDLVQIGNEPDAGMLWPLGQLYVPGADTLTAWTHFTRLLKAGISGVRSALGPGESLRILLHYSQGGDTGGTQWFFDHMLAYGVPFDLIGLSYYPWWHGTLGQLQTNMAQAAARYGKDIAVVETTYPWRSGGWEGFATDRTAMTWPVSIDGQAEFLRNMLDALAAVPGGHGAGVLWWYPEAVRVTGLSVWGDGSLSLFTGTGTLLPAASQFSVR